MSSSDILDALQLLAAMYPLEGELELSENASAALTAMEAGDEPSISSPLDAVVRVALDSEGDASSEKRIHVSITFSPDAPVRIAVRQPPFLPRAEFTDLEAGLAAAAEGGSLSDTIMAALEYVSSRGSELASAVAHKQEKVKDKEEVVLDDGELSRVWLWLPGLETREKVRDLVEYAPGYRLTGFVLAGKPGLICLEGGGKAVDRYMAHIKSESWGDVPSFQKKVTERLRRPITPSERKFSAMRDITAIVPHYGRYNHRGDMGEVKRLMDEWGVGDDFGAAVMNSS